MKFMKGVVLGSMVTAGIAMVYADSLGLNTNKMMKKGKKMIKKMGML